MALNLQASQFLLNRLLKLTPKALHHWPLWGESAGSFPSHRDSNTENVSIWWRHNGLTNEPLITSNMRIIFARPQNVESEFQYHA